VLQLAAAGSTVYFADDLTLFPSLPQGLQHALPWYSAVCDQFGMKISTKKTEVFCMLHVGGNTLQQVEKFMKYGLGFTNDGTRRLIDGLVTQT